MYHRQRNPRPLILKAFFYGPHQEASREAAELLFRANAWTLSAAAKEIRFFDQAGDLENCL
jgi:hypothetical protein